MANTVEYVIRIVADESAVAANDEASAGEKTPAVARTSHGDDVSQKDNVKKKTIFKTAAYGYAKRAVNTVASTMINTITLRTGSKELQDRVSFAYQQINQGWSIVESAIIGASVGGIGGAVAGAAVGVANIAINRAIESYNLSLARTVDSIGLEQANIRAGTGGSRLGKNNG